MVTFMDIVAYLKPKYVLMENVVDILKFADGYLGKYALSCLVALKYQARLGMMVAGCYGLPQFRMRVFLWGALSSMVCFVPIRAHPIARLPINNQRIVLILMIGDECRQGALELECLLYCTVG